MPPICPVCEIRTELYGLNDVSEVPEAGGRRYRVDCPKCGSFKISDAVNHRLQGSAADQAKLSGIIRSATDQNGAYHELITTENIGRILETSGAPRSVDDQIANFMLKIADQVQFLGEFTPDESSMVWAARAYLPNDSFLDRLSEELAKQGWIREGPKSKLRSYTLRMKGWERVGELRRSSIEGNLAFVAMWFDREMDEIFDNAISPALESCGYQNAYRVDRETFSERIDSHIVAQIRRCSLLVADVTGDRGGVYYEAGLAEGLGKPVIWCCNKSWETMMPVSIQPSSGEVLESTLKKWPDQIHFDTNHFPHLMWSNHEDLKKQLEDRIIALGLDKNTK
jgi:nucleoside 2-deoxyribosyltransferase